MGDAAVEILLGDLRQLQLYHADLISDIRNQVECLERDLGLLFAFLKDSTERRRKDESVRELVQQIHDVVYNAADAIDEFVTRANVSKSKKYFLRPFQKQRMSSRHVEEAVANVRIIYSRIGQVLTVGDEEPEKSYKAPIVRHGNVVGFEDEVENFIGYLREETTWQPDVISIIGMPGLGKTTLAWKIFQDLTIQYEFPTRIWVYEKTRKDIFLAILSQITGVNEDIKQKTDEELSRLVANHLEREKFLIVMDDVWRTEDWDNLRIALPKKNKIGKVLITSRFMEVAWYANRGRDPYQLRFLNPEESWCLLRIEVFGESECPLYLESVGKRIAMKCDGLPLAIVVIGGTLVEKLSTSEGMGAVEAWEEVHQNMIKYLEKHKPDRSIGNIISLSYDKLPFHLRPCFLYLSIFPEDFAIPVWKLTQMWIAEGFIQQMTGFSLEETAENYLEDLIRRNLVTCDTIKSDGKVRTCRIHDIIRDFCKTEVGNENENFLQEIEPSDDGTFEPPISDVFKYRRLCIHSNVPEFLSKNPYGPRVRSFVCFSHEEIDLPKENCSTIPAAFKLLRVLDVKPIKFFILPSELYQLVHLRYLALSFNSSILPRAFSKLWNIQVLILDTTSRTLEIKVDIWKLMQLRCIKTNASATLPKVGETSKGGENLQILGTISPKSCTREVFDRAWNLKKLGIRGQLSLLFVGTSFDSFGKLNNLEKLKLINDVFPSPPSIGQVRGLPPAYKFPPNLRRLTLSATFLDWGQMEVLGLLKNLQVLKLKDEAFVGSTWVATDGGFHSLEVLHIGSTNLVDWKAASHNFPRLKCLELRRCEELTSVPVELADIPSFKVLDLHFAKSAAASAKKIRDAVEKNQEKQTRNIFKLSIYPPEE